MNINTRELTKKVLDLYNKCVIKYDEIDDKYIFFASDGNYITLVYSACFGYFLNLKAVISYYPLYIDLRQNNPTIQKIIKRLEFLNKL